MCGVSRLSVCPALLDGIQIGIIGDKVYEEFPSQECYFDYDGSRLRILQDVASKQCLWSCFLLISQYC